MKYIDPKSLTIGVLAATLVFACTTQNNKTTTSPSLVSEAKAATGVGDKWDDKQVWAVLKFDYDKVFDIGEMSKGGWEPFMVTTTDENFIWARKRIR